MTDVGLGAPAALGGSVVAARAGGDDGYLSSQTQTPKPATSRR